MEEPRDSAPNNYLLDPLYRSSLVVRSNDLTIPKTKYYHIDLESQKDGGDEAEFPELPPKAAKRKRACTMCWCTACYVTIVVLLSLVIVIVKLVPWNPGLAVGNLELVTFDATTTGPAPQITSSVTFGLNVTNRNRHSDAIFSDLEFGLYFQDQSLANTTLPAFSQKRKKMTHLVIALEASAVSIQGQANADTFKAEVAGSNVQIQLRGSLKGKHKILGLKVKSINIDILCRWNIMPAGSGGARAKELQHSCYFDA